jgi:hypothetical protein
MCLARLGLRSKQEWEYVHSPDADYALKLAYVRAAEQLARQWLERYVVVYEDEITCRRPSIACAYARQGSKDPLAHTVLRPDRKRRLCASLNCLTG